MRENWDSVAASCTAGEARCSFTCSHFPLWGEITGQEGLSWPQAVPDADRQPPGTEKFQGPLVRIAWLMLKKYILGFRIRCHWGKKEGREKPEVRGPQQLDLSGLWQGCPDTQRTKACPEPV